jgi:hypothetical protein
MALAAFEGSCPVYIGDDLTDIPAFRAAQAMNQCRSAYCQQCRPAALRRFRCLRANRGDCAMSDGMNPWPIGNCEVAALVDPSFYLFKLPAAFRQSPLTYAISWVSIASD